MSLEVPAHQFPWTSRLNIRAEQKTQDIPDTIRHIWLDTPAKTLTLTALHIDFYKSRLEYRPNTWSLLKSCLFGKSMKKKRDFRALRETNRQESSYLWTFQTLVCGFWNKVLWFLYQFLGKLVEAYQVCIVTERNLRSIVAIS